MTWTTFKREIKSFLDSSGRTTEAPSLESSGRVFSTLKRSRPRITVKLSCYKCGGVGDKSKVCQSRDDDEYDKLKTIPQQDKGLLQLPLIF